MANRLHQVVNSGAVANGGSVVIPHLINVNGVPHIPDRVFFNASGWTVTAATTTTVTVMNNSGALAATSVWLEYFHTFERVFGASGVTSLSPNPFVVSGGGSGGGGGTDLHVQNFVFTAGVASDTFVVTLPAVRAVSAFGYVVTHTLRDVAVIIGISVPAAGRTLAQFTVVATQAIQIGDTIDFSVQDRTS